MVDRRKAFSLISSRYHCQRSSPSRISDAPWAGFEPAQNLSSGFVEWSCAVVITTTSLRTRLYVLNRSSHPEVFYREALLKNFSKFTGNTCNEHLWASGLECWTCERLFLFWIKNKRFLKLKSRSCREKMSLIGFGSKFRTSNTAWKVPEKNGPGKLRIWTLFTECKQSRYSLSAAVAYTNTQARHKSDTK